MTHEIAERLKKIPPYLFAEIEARVSALRAKGIDIIDFGIGDPDIPTPSEIVETLIKEVKDPANHQYPTSAGETETRRAVADWYLKRFGVDLDPEKEVIITMGSKEGLVNICRAFINPGDKVLVPSPSYPVYAQGGTLLSDGVPLRFPLLMDNNFLVDLDGLPEDAKMLFVNYPNNPTGAVATDAFLEQLAKWGRETGTIVCYDNAYSEITFDGYVAPSILKYGREFIEFGSLSKTFNMTGYRIGYAVGNESLISGLKKVKSQVDSGVPKFIQKAAICALNQYVDSKKPLSVERNCQTYLKRRDAFVRGMKSLGFDVKPPKGTFYLWIPVEENSMDFSKKLLTVGVVVTPGVGFGEYGEGYIRIALTQPVERIEEAIERMREIL